MAKKRAEERRWKAGAVEAPAAVQTDLEFIEQCGGRILRQAGDDYYIAIGPTSRWVQTLPGDSAAEKAAKIREAFGI